MAICNYCNQENAPEATICTNCGAQLSALPEEKPNTWLKVLSFLVPMVGVILWFINRKTSKKAAKAYGKMALISIALGIASIILFTIIVSIAGFGMLGSFAGGFVNSVENGDVIEYDSNKDDYGIDGTLTLNGDTDNGISITIDDVGEGEGFSIDIEDEETEEFVVPPIE